MPLTLITSADDALCEHALLEATLAAAQAGASPTLIAGGLTGPGWIEDRLAAAAPVGVTVSSASRFLMDLWGVHGDGRALVGSLTSEILMREAVAQSNPSVFGTAVRSPGFAKALLGMMGEQGRLGGDGRSDAVAVAVSEVLAEYRQLLRERGLAHTSEAVDNLTRGRLRLGGPVFVAGAEGLSPDMRRLCSALSGDNEVTFSLTWDREVTATRNGDPFVEDLLKARAAHIHLDAPVPDGEIAKLVSAMRRGDRGVIATGAVQLGLAAGREAEAAMIGDCALAATTNGIPAEGIVVVLPHLRAADLTLRSMRSAGLECRLRGSVPLPSTPFGRAFRALLARGQAASELEITGSPMGRGEAQRHRRGAEGPHSGDRLLGSAMALCREPLNPDALNSWRALADELLLELGSETQCECGHEHALNAAAHQTITRLLGEAAEEPGATLGDLLEAVKRRSAWVDSAGRGALVCDWKSINTSLADVAIVAGLSERDMPLRKDDGGAGQDTGESNDADLARLRFCAIASRVRNTLVLLRQDRGADGAPIRASRLWNEVLDAYQPARPGDPIQSPGLLRMTSYDIQEYAPSLTPGRRADRRAVGELSFGAAPLDRIGEASALEALARERTYSASEIESYLRCPQRWFWEWVIRPSDTDGVLDARELGLRAHGYLAEFYRRVAAGAASGWGRRDRPERAVALLAAVVQSESASAAPPASLPEELDAARAVRWARNVIEQDIAHTTWPFTEHVEMAFGDDDGFEFGGHRFRGRVDRVDKAGEAGLIVVDYKSSREVPGFIQFERAGAVQAVMYAAAVERALGRPVVASTYRSMTSGCMRGYWRTDLLGEAPWGMRESDGVTAEAAAEMHAQTEERVATALSGMKSGAIGCLPATGGSCDYCPVGAVCGGAR